MVKLSERPQDLTFFSFHCYLDGPNVDNRVTMAEDFKFQFCARFLQHLLNVTDNTVEAISMSPGKKWGKTTTRTDLMKEMAANISPMSTRKVLFKEDVENKDREVVDEETRDRNTAQEVVLDDVHIARGRAAAQVSILPYFKGMFGKKDKVHKNDYYGLFSPTCSTGFTRHSATNTSSS